MGRAGDLAFGANIGAMARLIGKGRLAAVADLLGDTAQA